METAFFSSFFWHPAVKRLTVSPNKSSFFMSVQPLEQGENLVRIFMVDLFQDSIRQLHSVNLPTPLARVSPVGKIFIPSFEPTEVVCVHGFLRLAVRSEKNSVLVIDKEFTRPPRLPSQFRLPRPELHVHVGIFVQPGGHRVQILWPIGHVQRDKRRSRMFLVAVISLR